MAVIENQHGVELENQEQEVYFNFMNSLKSPYKKESYSLNIKLYLKFCNLTKLSELLTNPEPQKQIIKYTMSLREKGLSTNSINTMLCAIYHLYEMNDVTLNKKKINMFIGEPTLKIVDRPYTYEEIRKLLDISGLRMKCVIGLMCSAGLRIGAFPSFVLSNFVMFS